MTTSKTKKILADHLAPNSITTIDEKNGIFQCLKKYNQQTYQILYVDCSNIWLQESFDKQALEAYQEKLLQKQYYTNAGPLQWNYYYAFISDTKQIVNNQAKKKDIEADELYSRKLVFTPEQLEEWLTNSETLSKPSQTLIEKDLGSIWIKNLKDTNLDAIYLDTSVAEGVRRYMAANPIIDHTLEGPGGKAKPDENKIFSIDKLDLINYRTFPTERNFTFKKVNLINGVNGTGKTSILEAIEFILCGQSYRNKDKAVAKFDIKVEINKNQTLLNFTHNNLKLFKTRDKAWYNSGDYKFNRLHVGFNKYNFFNSDAAFLLSHETDDFNVMKALEDITLGEDINRIEGRMINFKEQFNRLFSSYEKLQRDYNQERLQEEALTRNLSKQNQNPEEYLKLLEKEAKELSIKLNPRKFSIPKLEKDLRSAKTFLQLINENVKWSNVNSLKAISSQLEIHKKIEAVVKNLEEQIKNFHKQSESFDQDIAHLTTIGNLINKLGRYFKESRLSELLGLDQKLKKSIGEVSTIKSIQKLLTGLDITLFEQTAGSDQFGKFSSKLARDITNKESEISRIESLIKSISTGVNQIDTLITEIKAKGKQYVAVNKNATECPLCHTPYEYNTLLRLISKTKDSLKLNPILQENQDALSRYQTELSQLKSHQKIVSMLREIIVILPDTPSTTVTIKSLLKTINTLIKGLTAQEAKYAQLILALNYFKKEALTEREYNELIQELKEYGTKITNPKSFIEKNEQNKSQLASIKQSILLVSQSLKTVEKDIKTELDKIGLSDKKRDEIRIRIKQLENALKACNSLGNIFPMKPTEDLFSFNLKITPFEKILQQYKQAKTDKSEYQARLKNSNNKLKDLKKKISENKNLSVLAAKAVKNIDNLLIHNSKSAHLAKFISANKNEIFEIFKMIHTPKEFENLIFDNNKELNLKRIGIKDPASLTEISAGQRSALALSIFSALNRKLKNGPQVLMFDDPVVNVDDLNVLSYFDYLRGVAINGDRQIFFATANENLAFLFTQKFSFLGDEFQTITLDRK